MTTQPSKADRIRWKPGEDAVLRSEYGKGKCSAALIAKRLGRNRDEVIGRAHRLGLKAKVRWPIGGARKRYEARAS